MVLAQRFQTASNGRCGNMPLSLTNMLLFVENGNCDTSAQLIRLALLMQTLNKPGPAQVGAISKAQK